LLRKVFYTKYFAKILIAISYNFFFITKFVSIFYKKNFKTKLAGNINFFLINEKKKHIKLDTTSNYTVDKSLKLS